MVAAALGNGLSGCQHRCPVTSGDQAALEILASKRLPHSVMPGGLALAPHMYANPILGSPGTGLFETFGEGAGKAGQAGEESTAAVLKPFAQLPHVNLLHSVQLPGTNGDVDHVVLVGELLVLVDSKMWRRGTYSTNYNGDIFRDGELANVGSSQGYFPTTAAPRLAAITGAKSWMALTVVHGNVDIDWMVTSSQVHSYVTPQQLVTLMDRLCSTQLPTLNTRVFGAIRPLLKQAVPSPVSAGQF